ncbi:hypothetical protein CI109_105471 [Kwoniella shandongensis]|uniref:Protein CPL1-like domain-containing protein n=1 Tax=Kwoniella shandongensis TaxID=1734106 RepID=A0AAJ8MXE4_9TREE
MLYTLASAALLFLARLQQVHAANGGTYVGCVDTDLAALFGQVLYQNSPSECATSCHVRFTSTYSYYKPAVISDGSPATCYCSDTPPGEYYTTSEGTDGNGACYTTDYTTWVTASTYTFSGCYADLGPSTTFSQFESIGIVDGPEQCLRACVDYPVAVMGSGEGGLLQCACGPQSADFSGPSACAGGSLFTYRHAAGTSVNSQFAKRQLRERLVREKSSRRGVCPSPMTACKVDGVLNSFECINTNEELESCGGCAKGEFNDELATNGVDCTSLPNVARGGVTCRAGRCEAFACKAGFTLAKDSTCVAL